MKITKSAKTVDEAIKLAVEELGCSVNDVEVVVLEEPKSGFLGFGARNALVEVKLKEESFENLDIKKELTEEIKECSEKCSCGCENKDENFEVAKEFLLGLIEKMGTNGEVAYEVKEESVEFTIEKSDNFRMLIGKGGETLDSIQYILSIFARNNCGSDKRVYLDINGYKEKKAEQIREVAMKYAKKAIKYKKVMRLRPMNAYERRIVHGTLHNMAGVFTVSEGEEPYRKVVIKPKF